MEINIKCYSKGSNHMNRIEEKKEGTGRLELLDQQVFYLQIVSPYNRRNNTIDQVKRRNDWL